VDRGCLTDDEQAAVEDGAAAVDRLLDPQDDSFPALRLGLPGRGLLRDCFVADVVVFDPRTVSAPAT